jgi:hypothetical protein
MIALRGYPEGPRLWLAGQRVHHGATGCALLPAAILARRWGLVACAAVLVLHDRHDWRVWFARERLPEILDSAGELVTALTRPNPDLDSGEAGV